MKVMNEFFEEAKKVKVIPVIVFHSTEEVVPVMDALKEGGLKFAEITFRTECAQEALHIAAEKYPDFWVGAGTVLNEVQARQAVKSGAKFIVGPGFSERVWKVCQEEGVPYLPGCVTPTEIMQALACGLTVLKFFPANIYGGIQAIKALSAVFPQVRFIPTGGVNAENMEEYLAFEKILAVGGSWMMQGNREEIVRKTRECMEKAGKMR